MPNTEHVDIDRATPISEIEIRMNAFRSGPQDARVSKALDRLGFVHLRYNGFSVEEASSVIGVSIQTGYNWQNAWNREGMDSVMPSYSGGRESRMTPAMKSRLLDAVDARKMTTSEARGFIESEFGIRYSEKQVHIILSGAGLSHIPLRSDGPRDPSDPPASGRMVWTRRLLRQHYSKQ